MVQQLSITASEFLRTPAHVCVAPVCRVAFCCPPPVVFALSAGQLIVAVLHYLIQCQNFRTVYGG